MSRPPRHLLSRLVSSLTLAGLTLTGVGLSGVAAAPAAAATVSEGQRTLLSKINNARAADGDRRLILRQALSRVADRHAHRMADRRALFHNTSLGSQVTHWVRIGENVAVAGSVAEAHRALMNSWSHRAQILGGYREVGIGLARSGGRVWVVEVFRQPTYPRTVRLGSDGHAVKVLQRRLDLKATGTFGTRTQKAVKRFQARKGMDVHGVCGFRTWMALGF